MANAENAKPSEDDGALLAVEATDPVILQEPDRAVEGQEPPAPIPPKSTPKRSSGLLGFVLGGALVAGAGFGVARYVFPQTGATEALAAMQSQLDASAAAEKQLRADLTSLASAPAPDAALSDRLAAVEATLSALPDLAATDARLTALEEKLSAIEAASANGIGAPTAALAAMDRDLKSLRAQLDARNSAGPTAEAAATQARLDAAEAATISAAKQAALSHLHAALESGVPLAPALDGLRSLGAEIPAALAESSAIPSLLALQDGFAEPARAALDASIRADMGDGWANRLTSFLRTQSGARSLTPREGTDPDAILSRAEAALQAGQIKPALDELSAMPPAGAAELAPWVADATRRLAAEQAITDLSAALNGQ